MSHVNTSCHGARQHQAQGTYLPRNRVASRLLKSRTWKRKSELVARVMLSMKSPCTPCPSAECTVTLPSEPRGLQPTAAVHVTMTASPPGIAVTVMPPLVRHLPPSSAARAFPRISDSMPACAPVSCIPACAPVSVLSSSDDVDSQMQLSSDAHTNMCSSRPMPGRAVHLEGRCPVDGSIWCPCSRCTCARECVHICM